MWTATVEGAVFLTFGFGSVTSTHFLLLALLSSFWFILEDETTQLVTEVGLVALTTGLAVQDDAAIFDDDGCLRVLARLAKNKLGDEAIQRILQFGCFMGSVDDPTVILWIGIGLRTQFKPKVLDQIGRRTGEGGGDAWKVGHNGSKRSLVSQGANLRMEKGGAYLIPLPFPSILDCKRSILYR